ADGEGKLLVKGGEQKKMARWIAGVLGIAGDRFFDRDVPPLHLRRKGDKFAGVAKLVRSDDPQPPLRMRGFYMCPSAHQTVQSFFRMNAPSDKTIRPKSVAS